MPPLSRSTLPQVLAEPVEALIETVAGGSTGRLDVLQTDDRQCAARPYKHR